ncbi:MAG TPA: hypothetical protein VGC11_16140 [Acidimicrobiia bacterium]
MAAVDGSGTPATDAAIVAFLAGASATDNVGVTSLTNDAPATFPLGDTVVTFTALDAQNNSGTAQATLTVTDLTGPAVDLLFPLGGVVGSTTTLTVTADDTLNGVTSVTVAGVNSVPPVDLVQDPTDPTLWRNTAVDVATLGAPLTVTATDGVANTTAVPVPVRTGAVPAAVGGGDAFSGPEDVAPEAGGTLVVVDPGAFGVPLGALRVAPGTGDRTLIAASGSGDFPGAVQVADDGTIWVADGNQQGLLQVDEAARLLNLVYGPTDPDPTTGLDPTNNPWDFLFPGDFAIESAGSFLVLDATECSAFVRVDPGAATAGDQLFIDFLDPRLGGCVADSMAMSGTDIFYLDASGQTLYLLDPATDDTVVSGFDSNIPGVVGAPAGANFNDPIDLAVEPDGQILVIDYDGFSAATLLRVNPVTGDRTPLSGTGPSLFVPHSVVVDSRTGRIFVVVGAMDGSGGCLAGVWQVEPTTGDRALLSASPASDFFSFCGGSAF